MTTPAAARQPVTIKDVAERAGVSISTVSRVLDERRGPSQSPNADLVRKAAAELGYRRHTSASNLRRGSTHTIGVVVPRLTDVVMAMLYEELAAACQRADRFAIVATTADEFDQQRRAAERLLDRGVDGLVLATTRLADPYVDELDERGVPYVLAVRDAGTGLASLGDDRLGGRLAARHLFDLGHRDFALIGGPSYISTVGARIEGFGEELRGLGASVTPQVVHADSFAIDAGERACLELLAGRDRPPTAVFAMNDNTAIGALSALHRSGLEVPGDVSLIGYNDVPVASRLPVPLTTLRVPLRQIAASAIDLLLHGPLSPDERTLVAAPTLIPRASTAAPRG